jgi:hypothetical protein
MDAPAPTACLNCDAPLSQPRPPYCPQCGQETTLKPPTLREFAQQFGGAYVSTEGALWRTLKLLLTRPGALTAEYLAGRRRRYVLPLRLYLTVSVVVLLLVRLQAGLSIDVDPKAIPAGADRPRSITVVTGFGRAGLRDGVFYCEELPRWVCVRLERRLNLDAKSLLREMQALGERFVGNLGAAMFLLVPAFAAALKLAYGNRRLRYTEHLVFALHVHAFWFLMLALMLTPWSAVTLAALAAVPAYTLWAMRRVYGGRWLPRLARAAFIGTLYGATVGAALSLVAVWSLLF